MTSCVQVPFCLVNRKTLPGYEADARPASPAMNTFPNLSATTSKWELPWLMVLTCGCFAVATTVHPLQLSEEPLPMRSHDLPLDYIVTPDEMIACARILARPSGIHWDLLPRERIEEIPPVRRLLGVTAGATA